MPRKGYTVEEIISRLREAENLIQQGHTIGEAARKIGVSEYTYYRWRQRYGGIGVNQAKKLKELEKENSRLKKLVAELTVDNDILKEVVRGNF
jgi:transposase-like protein